MPTNESPHESSAPSATSPFVSSLAPITASDEEILAYLQEAEIPPLLPAIAYATGDLSVLREDLRPNPLLVATASGGLTKEQQEAARRIAHRALIEFRDNGSQPAVPPDEATLLRVIEFAVGSDDMSTYLPLLEEELAVRGEDRRAPGWRAAEWDFQVVIIGAGMSGLLCAHRLRQAGVPFLIVEKNREVGGTWLENTYPGCRVDNPNHSYSYSFAQRHDWPFHYSTQDVLLRYFKQAAEAFRLREHIQFETEAVAATWSDDDSTWTLTVRAADGTERDITANALVSAVGQLNRPLLPAIVGREAFEGPAFHSATWDHSVDLRGKRVAVIGTGASAIQFIPHVADQADELLVFQRTPPWIIPTPDYHDEVPAGRTWLYDHLPSYSEWNRFWLFWQMGDGAIDDVRVDPGYEPQGTAVSARNAAVRDRLARHLTAQFAARPDLLPHVIPDYPPGAKRMLRDNGDWARSLTSPGVRLVTDKIAQITPSGIRTADGTEHEVDVIIYGTGFQASDFLSSLTVRGRGGRDLHEQWDGDARAYLGLTIPGFPNLFCLYGPNTNIVVNGSVVFFSECGVRYILGALDLLRRRSARSLEVRKSVHDTYNETADAANRALAWGWSDVSSWYKNKYGRVAQNWPFTLLEYWQRTRTPLAEDYHLRS